MPQKANILIVEDEILIALSIKKMVLQHFSSVEVAKNYDEALLILKTKAIAIALLDVNLNDAKTGIDIANYINQHYKIPFIYLTAYTDVTTLQRLVATKPSAYLTKPLQEPNVITAITLALQQHKENKIALTLGSKEYLINITEFLYAKAENVYVNLYFKSTESLRLRTTLTELQELLPVDFFKRVNKSEAINPKAITIREPNLVFINNKVFKISKKY